MRDEKANGNKEQKEKEEKKEKKDKKWGKTASLYRLSGLFYKRRADNDATCQCSEYAKSIARIIKRHHIGTTQAACLEFLAHLSARVFSQGY